MRACSKCATSIVDEARFCPYCGAAQSAPAAAAPLPAGLEKLGGQLGAVAIIEEEAPSTIADPFSHTAPADPEELERVRAMIAGQSSEPVPVRERKSLGTTKPLVAVDDERTDLPPGVTPQKNLRERTMESPAIPAIMAKIAEQQDRVTPAPPQKPPSAVPSPSPSAVSSAPAISPRAATTASPSLGVGAAVRVLWSDGQAYPAVVTQMAPAHALVRFQNGATHWVELRFVLQS